MARLFELRGDLKAILAFEDPLLKEDGPNVFAWQYNSFGRQLGKLGPEEAAASKQRHKEFDTDVEDLRQYATNLREAGGDLATALFCGVIVGHQATGEWDKQLLAGLQSIREVYDFRSGMEPSEARSIYTAVKKQIKGRYSEFANEKGLATLPKRLAFDPTKYQKRLSALPDALEEIASLLGVPSAREFQSLSDWLWSAWAERLDAYERDRAFAFEPVLEDLLGHVAEISAARWLRPKVDESTLYGWSRVVFDTLGPGKEVPPTVQGVGLASLRALGFDSDAVGQIFGELSEKSGGSTFTSESTGWCRAIAFLDPDGPFAARWKPAKDNAVLAIPPQWDSYKPKGKPPLDTLRWCVVGFRINLILAESGPPMEAAEYMKKRMRIGSDLAIVQLFGEEPKARPSTTYVVDPAQPDDACEAVDRSS